MLQIPDKNTKEILALADFLDSLQFHQYDQKQYRSGDARCICGWQNERKGRIADQHADAAKDLGLTQEVAGQLFRGGAGQKRTWIGVVGPGPKDAARALRHLAVTGEIPLDW